MRIRIGHARLQADVCRHDGGAGVSARGEVVGIGETTDVVAHRRTRGKCRPCDRGAPGVDAQRYIEPPAQYLDGGHDALELFRLGHLGPGTSLHPADVEHVGPVADELLSLA